MMDDSGDVGQLVPDADERAAILDRLSNNDKFETLMHSIMEPLSGNTPTEILLALATALLMVKVEEDDELEMDMSKEVALAIFDDLVQDQAFPPRVMTLICAHLLARIVTKLEYVQSIHKLLGNTIVDSEDDIK